MQLHKRVLAVLVQKFKKDFLKGNKRKPTAKEVDAFRKEIKALAKAEPDDANT